MALSPAVTKELQTELAQILRDVEGLQDRANAIRKVLGIPRQSTTLELPYGLGLRSPVPEVPEQYVGMTMRQVVLSQLKNHPGWKAADVTRALKKEGYSRGGTTRFSHRVYNEIWRLEKDKLIVRDANGGFAVK
jgi:hypothetical protein